MIVLKEIVATRAHIMKYGSLVKQLDAALHVINCNPHFRTKIKKRGVKWKFNKMVKNFKLSERQDRDSPRVDDEQSPLEEMLCSIAKATECEEETEKKNRDETNQAEGRKLNSSRHVIENATADERYSDFHGPEMDSESNDILEWSRKRLSLLGRPQPRFEDDLAAFRASLRTAELTKVKLEQ